MTTSETPLAPDAASARLEALRAALDGADPEPSAPETTLRPGGSRAEEPDPELVARLRDRRSAGHVAAAYSAAHGHPTTADDGAVRSRWALSGPVAVAACGVLLTLALAVAAITLWSGGRTEGLGTMVDDRPLDEVVVEDVALSDASEAVAAHSSEIVADVVVHVVGQVADAGLVTLPAGARVADAVEAAGGATQKADIGALNLARPVVDGEQVYVPEPGEELPAVAPEAPGSTGTTDGGGSGPVPLNTAGTEALITLPGVGPVIAERIVAWRDEHGPFTRIEELTEVAGVGPAMLDNVRDLVTL
ncbi:ComEA family DNA-binding protein [Isoptericola croceus]|uniref:ComEA family DNA-binding protein n=1 Tax=Isoptericola croceus TaxID=3031406 RepID=UPI0023F6A552|nr:ComEA family DNA-binding protein [Isoptericola croceus]